MLVPRVRKTITESPKKLGNLIDLVNLPSTLREFVGQSQISRLGCFMRVWSYIKTNNLQSFARGISPLHNMSASFFQRLGFSSPASSETSEKEASQNGSEKSSAVENDAAAKPAEEAEDQSDAEEELSVNDLVKLVTEKDELVQTKQKEIEAMKDKVLRAYAEMENVMQRTKREAENSKKFAIQSFAKGLLDVADNLGRASSVVKVNFSKIDTASDTSAVVPLLKTLLEGVEMTEKQLQDVFKKSGIEKYEPVDEQFDPNRHNAVFQVPDATKPVDTVAVVLKAGYLLHERVLRPAEVGVRVAAADESS